MNLRDLEYILAIAEFKNMAKAAENCNVSQSTLSIQLKKLEGELGVVLFERNNKRVILSQEGLAILPYAEEIIRNAKAMRIKAKSLRAPESLPLKIGAFPTLAPYWFPKFVRQIRKNFPHLQLILIEEKTDSLLEKLHAGEIDCAALAYPVEDKDLAYKKIFKEPFFLAISNNHDLAKRKFIRPEEIADEEILLLDEGHCLRGQALDFCLRVQLREAQNYRATSLETLRNMVRAGSGMTIIPECAVPGKDYGISYIPFKKPEPGRTIAIYWRNMNPRADWIKKLADSLEDKK
jgi:LysR family hydrogen peroxide-inducible transcriptional activator